MAPRTGPLLPDFSTTDQRSTLRQHLHKPLDDDLVAFVDELRKVGSPARVWSLAASASARFPDTHGDPAVELLGKGVRVARTDNILAGARRCAYRIQAKVRSVGKRSAGGIGKSAASIGRGTATERRQARRNGEAP